MRTSTFLLALSTAFSAAFVFATPCHDLVDNNQRLNCYDQWFGKPDAAIPPISGDTADASAPAAAKVADASAPAGADASAVAAAKPEHHFWQDFALRDAPGPNATNPAVISVTKSGEENSSSLVQAALTWRMGNKFLPQQLHDWGWSWYSSIWANHNSASSSISNSRGLQVGAAGTVFDAERDGFALGTSANFNIRQDKAADTLTQGIAVDTRLIVPNLLVSGQPYTRGRMSWFVYPLAGVYIDHLAEVPEGQTSGTAAGGYIGIQGDYYPGGYLWRLKFHAASNAAKDLFINPGMNRRFSRLTRFGIDYSLATGNGSGPRQPIVPSLSLERIIGDNFLDGTAYIAETVLSLKVLTN
ncbi:hypothetical protein JCM19000A_05380 [Silvimonas sp. JCM 19000]